MYALGYDIGSSSIKCSLIDTRTGEVITSTKYPEQEMVIHSPEPGHAEQNPQDWWTAVQMSTRNTLLSHKKEDLSITSIGIAHQMHGLVCLDANEKILRPAIIWCDSRAVELGKELTDRIGSSYCETHLLNHMGNFTASKLEWVRRNEPEIYAQIAHVMLPGDYIAYRLTGTMTTTPGNLSEGVFWDFEAGKVSQSVLDALDLSSEQLPVVQNCFSIHGHTSGNLSEYGLASGIPVSYKAGDQPNNALALGVMNPGEIAGTGGTSGVIYAVTDELIYDPMQAVNSFAHVNHGSHNRIGILLCINSTGILLAWVRRLLGAELSYPEMESLAREVPAGSDGLLVIPFGNGAERMLNLQKIHAHIENIDLNRHDRRHIIRATLEALAMAYAYGIDRLRSMGVKVQSLRVGDDNLFQSDIFSQTLADLAQVQIQICHSSGARGAALASASTIGISEAMEHLTDQQQISATVHPDPISEELTAGFDKWKKALQSKLA